MVDSQPDVRRHAERGATAAGAAWVTESASARRLGRAYFALQALGGAAWWICVFTVPAVGRATLGGLDPLLAALCDVPLFVLASALAATGRRWAMAIAVPWTLVMTVALAVYATATGLAGWGALIMVAASCGGLVAWMLAVFGRIPAEELLRGPLGFRAARSASPLRQLGLTLLQLAGFWLLFLAVLPGAIRFFELRWRVDAEMPAAAPAVGWILLIAASALGLWAAFAMSLRGDGTPLPSVTANRLVVAGPYRWVRNPMAVAGIAQAVGVGLVVESWLVVVYACCGAVYWNQLVRPFEEADLESRHGAEFAAYRARVGCWVPRRGPRRGARAPRPGSGSLL